MEKGEQNAKIMPEKIAKKLQVGVGFLLLLAVLLGLYFSYDWYQGKNEERAMSVAYQNVMIDGAYAQLLFSKGGEENRKEAVVFLKNKIAETKYQNIKVLFINQLLGFYYLDLDNSVYEEIFSGEPLQKFKKENERDSLFVLATESNLLYPTSFALFNISSWHAARILGEDLTNEDKQKEANKIITYVSEAEKLFLEKEIIEGYANIFGAQNTLKYYHFKALMLGAVSTVYPSYQKEMEESFQKAIDLNNNEPKSSPSSNSLPYTHFYYASFLSELEGDSRQTDIEKEIEALTLGLEENSTRIYEQDFINFARLQSERTSEKRDHTYKWFSLLTKNHPNFREFLSSRNIFFE